MPLSSRVAQEQPEIYAIDFGTSNSLLAPANSHRVFPAVELDPAATDPTVLRSILYFTEKSEVYFGAQGLSQYVERGMEGRLLRSLKRFLPYSDFRSTYVGNRSYRLEELIGAVLRQMRERANQVYGCDVRRALLGRPARYAPEAAADELAERRMREAARRAGFEEVEFCAEPIAAARDFDTDLHTPKTVLVADFGGGTSDFCVVRMTREGFEPEGVLATGGISLAGDALDAALMKRKISHLFGAAVRYRAPFGTALLPMPAVVMDMLCTPAKLPLLQGRSIRTSLNEILQGCDSEDDREALDRLSCVIDDALGFQVFEAVEECKRALSAADSSTFRFDYADMDLQQEVSRTEFDAACTPPVSEILRNLDDTLLRAGVSAEQVDLVCLTGGTSRVPLLYDSLAERFAEQRLRRLKGLHSVVGGLAHQARLLLQER